MHRPSISRVAALLAGAFIVILSASFAEAVAQQPGGRKHQANPGRASAPRAAPRPPSRPAGAPRATFRAPSHGRSMPAVRTPRQVQRQTPRAVTPQVRRRIQPQPRRTVTPRIQRDIQRRAPRVVAPKAPSVAKPPVAPATPRLARPRLRALPSSSTALNPGLRTNPGTPKPPSIVHNASHKAGKAGWQHRHKPFYFKRGGHRWKRIYYSFPLAGLWYWYWSDVIADDEPAVLVYSDLALPDCDEDQDECTLVEGGVEGELIAPAILEGRATDDMLDRCADRYKSFDRRTGTFTAYSGEKRACPYLM